MFDENFSRKCLGCGVFKSSGSVCVEASPIFFEKFFQQNVAMEFDWQFNQKNWFARSPNFEGRFYFNRRCFKNS